VLLAILELVLLWLPFELDTLYNTRLGFMRQILFMNESYPVNFVLWIAIILLIISVLLFIRWVIKSIQHKCICYYGRYSVLIILAIISFVFMILPNNSLQPLYFYDLASLSLALVIQLGVIGILK
jgi:hypothetical protein